MSVKRDPSFPDLTNLKETFDFAALAALNT
jgi:hypothetical protein